MKTVLLEMRVSGFQAQSSNALLNRVSRYMFSIMATAVARRHALAEGDRRSAVLISPCQNRRFSASRKSFGIDVNGGKLEAHDKESARRP
jgi:hypothetical protein